MRRALGLAVLAFVACKPALTPTEQAAKDRSECMVVAQQQSSFDPLTAEEPPRTVSSDLKEGAGTVGEPGVVGGLMGGAKHQESHEMVTTTRPNPDYQKYVASKTAYKSALEQCLAARAGAPK